MAIEIKPIRTETDYEAALETVEKLWRARRGTEEGDALDVLATLIDEYESRIFPINLPGPVEAIKFQMEQKGLTRRDLEGIIGARGRISEVLDGKRSLSIAMIRRLHAKLEIPLELLIGPSKAEAAE